MSLYANCIHGIPAGSCHACDYAGADRAEKRAQRSLAVICVIVLALLIWVLAAGACGSYPLAGLPDAGADAGLAPCTAPAGYVVIAHGCDCASDPLADSCSTETVDGFNPAPLVGCELQNGEHCIASCAGCAP